MRIINQSLFRKIFLWFWLAIGMALLSSAVIVSIARKVMGPGPSHTAQPEEILADRLERAATIAKNGGSQALADYARQLDADPRERTYIIDQNGRDVRGQQAPASVLELARQASQSGKPEYRSVENRIAAGRIQGEGSWLLAVSREQPSDGDAWLVIRLALEVAMVALGALMLARYITSPILKLRDVTTQIESGNLSARVMGRLGLRRDELGDLGRSFDRMAARVETLVGAQRDLISDVSHELRSPLARLNLALGLARRNAGTEAAAHLARIESEAERLNSLIGQLLTLSRLDNGLAIEKAPLDFTALIQEVAADAVFEARARDCSVTVQACTDCTVLGSVETLRSAIENVVRNAVRFAADQSAVEIVLERRSIEGKSIAVLTVRDHGPGVPHPSLPLIFQPFYRVLSGNAAAESGTGLGLAITFRAIGLHNGSVRAFSPPDGGLAVEIRLPAVQR